MEGEDGVGNHSPLSNQGVMAYLHHRHQVNDSYLLEMKHQVVSMEVCKYRRPSHSSSRIESPNSNNNLAKLPLLPLPIIAIIIGHSSNSRDRMSSLLHPRHYGLDDGMTSHLRDRLLRQRLPLPHLDKHSLLQPLSSDHNHNQYSNRCYYLRNFNVSNLLRIKDNNNLLLHRNRKYRKHKEIGID